MPQKPPPTLNLSWLQPVDMSRRKQMDRRFVMERDPKHPKVWIVRPREPKEPKV